MGRSPILACARHGAQPRPWHPAHEPRSWLVGFCQAGVALLENAVRHCKYKYCQFFIRPSSDIRAHQGVRMPGQARGATHERTVEGRYVLVMATALDAWSRLKLFVAVHALRCVAGDYGPCALCASEGGVVDRTELAMEISCFGGRIGCLSREVTQLCRDEAQLCRDEYGSANATKQVNKLFMDSMLV